ncbi:MAG: FAD binding domain-containing protein [Tissierellaceae bacterium]|nr:FAD binding domain-containing protein [Tissierellaceae bacterium]
MIPFDFEYYRPSTISDAINLFNNLDNMGKQPIYYGGGTEFISMARMHNVYTQAVIDTKGIKELNICEIRDDELNIGAAVTLTQIAESNLFPLLSLTVKRIADHTIQDKITLGGNIAGTIIYRESVLPLMVSDADIVIAGKDGLNRLPFKDVFDKRIKLNKGELICSVIIKKEYLSLPSLHVKRTKNEKIDYPLITIAALKRDNQINIAFSGLCKYPFRSSKIEKILNKGINKDKKIKKLVDSLNDSILEDISGSAEYKKFLLHTMLYEALENLEEAY